MGSPGHDPDRPRESCWDESPELKQACIWAAIIRGLDATRRDGSPNWGSRIRCANRILRAARRLERARQLGPPKPLPQPILPPFPTSGPGNRDRLIASSETKAAK